MHHLGRRSFGVLLFTILIGGCGSLVGELASPSAPPDEDGGAGADTGPGDGSPVPSDGSDADADGVAPPDGGDAGADAPIDASTFDANIADVDPRVVGDWWFDEGFGTKIHDLSGRGNHGSVIGTGHWVANAAGHAGSALAFATINDYVAIPGHPDFDRPADATFSMTAWMRTTDEPDHDMFFSVAYGDSYHAFGIELRTATHVTYWDGYSHVGEATIPNVLGQWHHYGIAVDGSQVRVYFDGVRVGEGVADTTPRVATQVLIGRSNYADRLIGAVDRVRFFHLALTDDEMMAEKNR